MRRKGYKGRNSKFARIRDGRAENSRGGRVRAQNRFAEKPPALPEPVLGLAEVVTFLRSAIGAPRGKRVINIRALCRNAGVDRDNLYHAMAGSQNFVRGLTPVMHARLAPWIKRFLDGELAYTKCLEGVANAMPYNPKERARLEPKWPFI